MTARINLPMIEAISSELEPYRDDAAAFWDTLEGETDALTVIDGLIAVITDAEALAAAVKAQEADMKARRQRVEDRAHTARRLLGQVMAAAGERSVQRPRATISIRDGKPSVAITDESAVPTQLRHPPKPGAPDKSAIMAQIDAGVTVPGAELVTGDQVVTVRIK